MAENNDSPQKPDYDFAAGFMILILAYIASVSNLAIAFVMKDSIHIFFATVCFFWFLLAPVYFTKQTDPEQWTLSQWGNSIWSSMVWRAQRGRS